MISYSTHTTIIKPFPSFRHTLLHLFAHLQDQSSEREEERDSYQDRIDKLQEALQETQRLNQTHQRMKNEVCWCNNKQEININDKKVYLKKV